MKRRELLAGLTGIALVGAPRLVKAADAPKLLTVARRTIEVKGKAATVYGITGPDGKPGLEMLLGERFNVRLKNDADTSTVVHWHGLTPPYGQDGVAMMGQDAITPGQSKDYDFANLRAGTHWMHSHLGLQEQQLLAAPLIVRNPKDPQSGEQEHVVMLHDFTFRDPQAILADLEGTAQGQSSGGAASGHDMSGMKMDGMRMDGMDMSGGVMLNDVVYDAYLANDRTLDDPEVVAVEKGGTIRLRIINGAAASNMWIDLGALDGELVAVDGNAIYPTKGRLFPIAMGQRADVRVSLPKEGGAFPVLFRPEGLAERTGIVLASAGAAVPKFAAEGEMTPAVDLSQELLYRSVDKLPPEPVTRTEMLMLTGTEEGYLWGFNNEVNPSSPLLSVRQGERMAVMMHNMTMMYHPMHLHGHHFKVAAIGDTAFDGALRDVVLVPPMETVTIVFDADNPGTWPFHCHHAYHMNAGMMGTLAYTSAA